MSESALISIFSVLFCNRSDIKLTEHCAAVSAAEERIIDELS